MNTATRNSLVLRTLGKELALAICLGFAFLGLSYARVLGDMGSAAFGSHIIDTALSVPLWGTALGNNLILFAVAQCLVHVALGVVCIFFAHLTKLAYPLSRTSARAWTLFWFVLSAGWLLIANAALFRWSSLGSPYADLVTAEWHGLSIYTCSTAAIIAAAAWVIVRALSRIRFDRTWWTHRWLIATAVVTLTAATTLHQKQTLSRPSSASPHVILIGLDSLRFDAVLNSPMTMTPAIDAFLQESHRFADAITPLARTFPSWVTILTGKHPHSTGALINLLPREHIDTGESLPTLLSQAGYKTVYAIDEVRFSNLDHSFGFDETITPPIGATDFVLSFFTDAPLTNLVINSRAGKVLFPHAHANRAFAITYDPDSFVRRLSRELQFDTPTLLAVHMTLAHWPHMWADSKTASAGGSNTREFYDEAVRRLDRQFEAVMSVLKDQGALDNAIVVLLSDHGESLGTPPTGPVSNSSSFPEHEESKILGHGTSVFSRHQYHVVLAFRSFGESAITTEPSVTTLPASLEDVTPTIVEALGIHTSDRFDGQSLLAAMDGGKADLLTDDRIRFTETEFNPPGFLPGQIISASALQAAASYYRVDPETDRVLVRDERLLEVLSARQYAAIKGDKMLALVPATASMRPTFTSLLVVGNGVPTHVAEPSAHADPDVRSLWLALVDRYPPIAESLVERQTSAAEVPTQHPLAVAQHHEDS